MDPLTRKRALAFVALIAWFAQAIYILSPFDLLPDFIPILGWIDDLVGLVGLVGTTLWMVRAVREVGVHALLGIDPPAVEATPYDPIPTEVLRRL